MVQQNHANGIGDGYTRIARLLALVELLKSGHPRNAQELAEGLGVSRRTIFRDLSALQQAGIQVHYDTATMQYSLPWQVSLGAQVGPVDACAIAILLGRADTPELKRAATFIEAVLMNRLSQFHQQQIRDALSWVIPPEEVLSDAQQREHLERLFFCYHNRQKARIAYRVTDERVTDERDRGTLLSPSQLVVSNTTSQAEYLIVGYSSYHREAIGVPLNRIQSSVMTEELFELNERRIRVWRQE